MEELATSLASVISATSLEGATAPSLATAFSTSGVPSRTAFPVSFGSARKGTAYGSKPTRSGPRIRWPPVEEP